MANAIDEELNRVTEKLDTLTYVTLALDARLGYVEDLYEHKIGELLAKTLLQRIMIEDICTTEQKKKIKKGLDGLDKVEKIYQARCKDTIDAFEKRRKELKKQYGIDDGKSPNS